ncbi:MAG: TonB-dependent receptor, partial [Cyclobacteriaceae bacterium]
MVTDPYLHMSMANQANQRSRGTDAYPQFRVEAAKRWSENPTPENAWHVEEGTLYWVGGGEETLIYNRFFRDVIPKLDYHVEVQGGTEKSNYYASMGWVDQPGIFKPEHRGESFQRLNANLKVELNVADWLTLNENLAYTNNKQDYPHYYTNQAEWNMLQRTGVSYYTGGFPSTDLFDVPDFPGRDYSEYEGMYIGSNHFIPYYERGGRDLEDTYDLYLTQGVTINPIENLEFRGNFTFRQFNRRRENVRSEIEKLNGIFNGTIDLLQDEMITPGYSSPTFIENEYDQNQYYYLYAVGEYDLSNEVTPHDFKAMVGFNQEWNINRYGYMQAYDMITPAIQSIRATSGDQIVRSNEGHLALRGVFSRLNYSYDNRYLLEFSGRYDGTSRFPGDDRWGFFPSGSAGWRISEENFLNGVDFLSNFMLRASYGEIGNNQVPSFQWLSTYNLGSNGYPFGMAGETSLGLVSGVLPNEFITWEVSKVTNFGMDAVFWHGLLGMTVEVFQQKRSNILAKRDLA